MFNSEESSPLTRDWLKFRNIDLEKMSSFMCISFTGTSPSGQAFLVLRALIICFTLSIETSRKLKEELFFDFILYYIEIWHSFTKIFFKRFSNLIIFFFN